VAADIVEPADEEMAAALRRFNYNPLAMAHLYSEYDEGLNVPFGAEVALPDALPLRLSLRGMYDGERTHAMLSHARSGWSASLLLIWLEQPGFSVAVGF